MNTNSILDDLLSKSKFSKTASTDTGGNSQGTDLENAMSKMAAELKKPDGPPVGSPAKQPSGDSGTEKQASSDENVLEKIATETPGSVPEYVKEASDQAKAYYSEIASAMKVLEDVSDEDGNISKEATDKVALAGRMGRVLTTGIPALAAAGIGAGLGAGGMGAQREEAKANFFNYGFDLGQEAMAYEIMEALEKEDKASDVAGVAGEAGAGGVVI